MKKNVIDEVAVFEGCLLAGCGCPHITPHPQHQLPDLQVWRWQMPQQKGGEGRIAAAGGQGIRRCLIRCRGIHNQRPRPIGWSGQAPNGKVAAVHLPAARQGIAAGIEDHHPGKGIGGLKGINEFIEPERLILHIRFNRWLEAKRDQKTFTRHLHTMAGKVE